MKRYDVAQDTCPECGAEHLVMYPYVKMCYPPIEMWRCKECGYEFTVQDRVRYPGIPCPEGSEIKVGPGKSYANVSAASKMYIKEEIPLDNKESSS